MYERLKVRVILRRIHSNNPSSMIEVKRPFDAVFGLLVGMFPCLVQSLHEQRVAFNRRRIVLLLDCDIAAGTCDIADVKEVVAAKPFLRDFSLFSFVAIVKGDDRS